MNTIEIPDYVYERILKILQEGLDVCYNVDYASDVAEKSASYATGYCRGTIQEVIKELNNYKTTKN